MGKRRPKDMTVQPNDNTEIKSKIVEIPEECIKKDNPTVSIAIERTKDVIAEYQNEPLVKIIHGYGSSGKGGDIRIAVRGFLKSIKGKEIVDFIPGEEYTGNLAKEYFPNGAYWDNDYKIGGNEGMTIIIFKKDLFSS